jgi:hypothetical protein
MFFNKVGSNLTRRLLPFKDYIFKGLKMTNTLAYSEYSLITAVKGFITMGPVVNPTNFFHYSLTTNNKLECWSFVSIKNRV